MADVFLGTSGYSYDDWSQVFYPEGLDKKEQLNFYGTVFNTVEINFTYYSLPRPSIFLNMARKVPDGFVFSIKGFSRMTHTRDYTDADMDQFKRSLLPLIEQDKFATVLLQFPWSFRASMNNLDYISKLKTDLGDLETCVEFRNDSWLKDKVFERLKGLGIGFCNVDEPGLKGLLPPTEINTTDVGYIRFHGRNNANWWNPKQAFQRYDYMYKREELDEWVPGIKKVSGNTKKTVIYFNNHYKAQAVRSAKILQRLLENSNITTSQK